MNSSQASHEGWAWERPWGGDRKIWGRKGGVTWLHKVVMGPTCAAASLVEVGVDSFPGNPAVL